MAQYLFNRAACHFFPNQILLKTDFIVANSLDLDETWKFCDVQLDTDLVITTLLTINTTVVTECGLVKFYLGHLRFV